MAGAATGRMSLWGGHMKTSPGRKWPYILAFIVGPLVSITAAVLGFLVPVGPKCNGAFATDHGETILRYETACITAAQTPQVTYFSLIGGGIAILLLALAFWIMRPEPVKRVFVSAEIANRPAARRERSAVPDRGPVWPYVVGSLISVIGIVMGYTVPVGRHCSGAFSGNHMDAAGYDIAYVMTNGVQSYVSEACLAAAPGQTGIYFGIIGFGIAVVILGVVLRSSAGRNPAAAQVSVADELNRLDGLRTRGILTDAEFETQKRQLLRS